MKRPPVQTAAALLVGFCLFGTPAPSVASPQTITPGAVWQDTEGHVIQAHGGGFVQVGKTYYWFGEDHSNGAAFKDVPCYSSTDLAHWTFRGDALTRQPSGDLGPNRVVERPKVIYNRRTKQYVMYVHVDSPNYSEAKLGVATSVSVTGPYTYLGSFRPMGHQSRDMTLFQDTDGTAYVVFEDRADGAADRIEQLSPDYLSVQSEVAEVASARRSRGARHRQGRRGLFPARLPPHRLGPQRQRVRHRVVAGRAVVRLSARRPARHPHLQLPDRLHPPRPGPQDHELRVRRGSLEAERPGRLALRLDAPDASGPYPVPAAGQALDHRHEHRRDNRAVSMRNAPLFWAALGALMTMAMTPLRADGGWPAPVAQAVARAGDNRAEIVAALQRVPPAQITGMEFLVANMPDGDLRTLSSAFLLRRVALAYGAWQGAPWKGQISQDAVPERRAAICLSERDPRRLRADCCATRPCPWSPAAGRPARRRSGSMRSCSRW